MRWIKETINPNKERIADGTEEQKRVVFNNRSYSYPSKRQVIFAKLACSVPGYDLWCLQVYRDLPQSPEWPPGGRVSVLS